MASFAPLRSPFPERINNPIVEPMLRIKPSIIDTIMNKIFSFSKSLQKTSYNILTGSNPKAQEQDHKHATETINGQLDQWFNDLNEKFDVIIDDNDQQTIFNMASYVETNFNQIEAIFSNYYALMGRPYESVIGADRLIVQNRYTRYIRFIIDILCGEPDFNTDFMSMNQILAYYQRTCQGGSEKVERRGEMRELTNYGQRYFPNMIPGGNYPPGTLTREDVAAMNRNVPWPTQVGVPVVQANAQPASSSALVLRHQGGLIKKHKSRKNRKSKKSRKSRKSHNKNKKRHTKKH